MPNLSCSFIFPIFSSTFSDIIYAKEEDTEDQFLVPLMSPTETTIQFWVEPFEERCRNDLRSFDLFHFDDFIRLNILKKHRIHFAYSRSEEHNSKNNKSDDGCSICANTIYGSQFGDSKKSHLIVINGSLMDIHEDGIERSKNTPPIAVCPLKLRRWEASDDKQF